ncbi:MAG TPA: nicotinate-nucleotide--dimethylbenzimidazole phosphoribosyltransferase [Acidimicrobiales bacterium]|nr:nicotinate-nucleotide--dimethylbenzimidazole phosphoribosyltransferase [Acidimicrobiales bacterium]
MTSGAFEEAAAKVRPVDEGAAAAARQFHLSLTKPPGSLGRLEDAGVQLAAIAGVVPPPVPEPAAVAVFAGDHGVLAEGVSPWPAEVTAQMVANFCAGGAAINVLARHAGASVTVVDVGVATPHLVESHPNLVLANVRRGTGDLMVEPAMTLDEATQALDVGAEVAASLVAGGARCLVTGDMGIGNTTPSAALVAAFTGRSAAQITGRGTGIDDETLARKVQVVDAALARTGADGPLATLASLGGLEHAALAGFMVGAAAAGVPAVVDGVIACSALLAAVALVPDVLGYCIAGHRSSEPGASAVLAHLGLVPVLDLELRLGEGSGACLAVPVVQAAAKIMREMATFDSAGVSSKT